MTKPGFASTSDMSEKTISFSKLGEGLYAYTAEGDPNTGVIVGDDCCMVIDAQATPLMARDVAARVKAVTDKPIKYVLLSHYHAVRVLGASGFAASEVIASDTTRKLIVERGEQMHTPEAAKAIAAAAPPMPTTFEEDDYVEPEEDEARGELALVRLAVRLVAASLGEPAC